MSKLTERITQRLGEDGKRCWIDSHGGYLRITIKPPLRLARHLRACGVRNPIEDFVIVISPRRFKQMMGEPGVGILRGGDAWRFDTTNRAAIAAAVALSIISQPLHELN